MLADGYSLFATGLSYSQPKRSFSSITLLAFQGMSTFLGIRPRCSFRNTPGSISQASDRSGPIVVNTRSRGIWLNPFIPLQIEFLATLPVINVIWRTMKSESKPLDLTTDLISEPCL